MPEKWQRAPEIKLFLLPKDNIIPADVIIQMMLVFTQSLYEKYYTLPLANAEKHENAICSIKQRRLKLIKNWPRHKKMRSNT